MQRPFVRHTKRTNSSQFRKIYKCVDHVNCSHLYTIIEGKNEENVLGFHFNLSTFIMILSICKLYLTLSSYQLVNS